METDRDRYGQGDKGGFTPAVCLRCGYRRKKQGADHCFLYDMPCVRVYGYCRKDKSGRDQRMKAGPVRRIGPVGR